MLQRAIISRKEEESDLDKHLHTYFQLFKYSSAVLEKSDFIHILQMKCLVEMPSKINSQGLIYIPPLLCSYFDST